MILANRPADWKVQTPALTDKCVLLSGGSTGIGRATLRMLAAEGARVLTYARHEETMADALADSRGLPGEVNAMLADEANNADLQRVFEHADKLFGHLDIVINNAAVAAGGVTDTTPEEIRYVINANLGGYLVSCRLAAERMIQRGSGHIINIGSMSADEREGGSGVYVATKAAIQGFTESLRKEVNDKGIKVSLIEPGRVGTNLNETSPREQRLAQQQHDALTAEDIAECVYYCLTQSPRCDVVSVQLRPHGQVI